MAIVVPLGFDETEHVLETVVEDYPIGAKAPRERDESRGVPTEPRRFVRVIRVASDEQPRVDALTPDPFAMSTWVVPGAEFRVLDPSALELVRLGPARLARPLALQVRARGAQEDDRLRVFVAGREIENLRVESDEAGLRARIDLAPLEAGGVEVVVLHDGERGGRVGSVEMRTTVVPGPAPRVTCAGVSTESPFARALALQGFAVQSRDGEESERTELWLADLSAPPPAGFAESVDAGAGAILVARAGARFDEAWRDLLPVLSVPVEDPKARVDDESAAAAKSQQVDPKATRDDVAAPQASKDLRRVGAVSDAEREAAAAQERVLASKAVALILLVDVSGSMSGPVAAPAIVQAKRAARETAATLGEGDAFALVSFGERVRVVLELGSAARLDELTRAIDGLEANASKTEAYLALSAAWGQLKRSDAPVRHVLLLTDGEFTDKEQDYLALVTAMHREGIGLSAIGSLSGSEGPAAIGKFRFLNKILQSVDSRVAIAKSPNEIQRLVLGEVREVLESARPLAAGGASRGDAGGTKPSEPKRKDPERKDPERKDGLQEDVAKAGDEASQPDTPDVPDTTAPVRLQLELIEREPVLAGLTATPWPDLSGALGLEAAPRARVHWAFAGSGRTALATALHGLGRLVVWAGDDGSRWSREFAGDARFPALVGQLASWCQPSAPVDRDDDARHGHVRVDSRRVTSGDGLTPDALDAIAVRVGGKRAASIDGIPDQVVGREQASSPATRILAILAAVLGVVLFEAVLARRRGLLARR